MRNGRPEAGFTYLALLIAIIVMGIGLAAIGPVARTLQLRQMENELLFAGDQIRRAIESYYESSPAGLKQYPKQLEDLLRDARYPGVRRYLRRVYPDPMTGKKEWGLVEYPGIGITGVYSTSDLEPLRKTGFPALYRQFENTKKYSDWKFVHVPGAPQPLQQAPVPQAR